MSQRRKLLIPFLVLGGLSDLSAQEVIATQGGSFSTPSAQIDFAIGEVMMSTLSGQSTTLYQGFHSGHLLVTPLNVNEASREFSVYPNPVMTVLNIDFKENQKT